MVAGVLFPCCVNEVRRLDFKSVGVYRMGGEPTWYQENEGRDGDEMNDEDSVGGGVASARGGDDGAAPGASGAGGSAGPAKPAVDWRPARPFPNVRAPWPPLAGLAAQGGSAAVR